MRINKLDLVAPYARATENSGTPETFIGETRRVRQSASWISDPSERGWSPNLLPAHQMNIDTAAFDHRHTTGGRATHAVGAAKLRFSA
ncbi:hypothetical protein [Azoarcus taiwanensis]|uniref:Uncharacterized protein n=1 Tax=Azoarcus taiwanensis TaxID=666964 RepID=A0A972FD19_9RHOO|nr:hypothetical protein [Azoarcus taiwanensis]NMG03168.1 hypothetical protein [Azoarcus taiwanensis]